MQSLYERLTESAILSRRRGKVLRTGQQHLRRPNMKYSPTGAKKMISLSAARRELIRPQSASLARSSSNGWRASKVFCASRGRKRYVSRRWRARSLREHFALAVDKVTVGACGASDTVFEQSMRRAAVGLLFLGLNGSSVSLTSASRALLHVAERVKELGKVEDKGSSRADCEQWKVAALRSEQAFKALTTLSMETSGAVGRRRD